MNHIKDRWDAVDTKCISFKSSPFGVTADGLKDFRGLYICGTESKPVIFDFTRFENCDLSDAKFERCKINSSEFINCRLHRTDFSRSELYSTKLDSDMKDVVWHEPSVSGRSWKEVVLERVHPFPKDYIQFSKITEFQIESKSNAVLFYHGAWSGPSVRSLELLGKKLSSQKKIPTLIIFNADDYNDSSPDQISKLVSLFGPKIGANGETAWIINGEYKGFDILNVANVELILEERIKLYL